MFRIADKMNASKNQKRRAENIHARVAKIQNGEEGRIGEKTYRSFTVNPRLHYSPRDIPCLASATGHRHGKNRFLPGIATPVYICV